MKKGKNSDYAYCSVCKKSFWIVNSGLSQVKSHARNAGHKAKEALLDGKTSQCVLVSSNSITVSLFSSTITFLFEEQVLTAEMLQNLDCVYSDWGGPEI